MNEKIAAIERDIVSLELDLLKIRREEPEDATYKATRRKSTNAGDEEIDNEELSVTEKIISELADFSKQASYEDARLYLEKAREMDMDPAIFRGAYRLFLLGALTKKCPKCWYGVGLCIYNGYGMKADEDLGSQILEDHFDAVEALARKDDSEAMIILYECYDKGHGVYPNKDKATEWLKKAAKAKNPRALYLRAGCEDEAAPFDLLTESFNKGFHLSFYALGLFYYHGYYMHSPSSSKKRQTVNVDYDKATRFNRQGAGIGDGRCIRRQAELRELKKGFKIFEGKLTDYTGDVSGVVNIPKCVTTIEGGALSRCSSYTEVVLPESVTYVSPNAFGSRTQGFPKITSVNNSYNVSSYLKRIKEAEKHRKRENVRETLFVNNPHKTFTISWLVLIIAFLAANMFLQIVPQIAPASWLYLAIFGGCGVAVLIGYVIAMAKGRSGWQVVVGSLFVSALMFLAGGANIIPEDFRTLALIGAAIMTFCGVVITYFDYPGDIFGKTLTYTIIVAVVALPFVAFELIFPYQSTADTLVKAIALMGAITMVIAAVRYTKRWSNWSLHRILFLVFYVVLMSVAYLVGDRYELVSTLAILASVAATVYGYVVLNDHTDKPMVHGACKLITTVVVVGFFGIFDGFNLPSIIPMLIFIACAIAMIIATVVAYKNYANELAEIICVPFFGTFVALALFGGAMSSSFIFIAAAASVIAAVITIMMSAELDFDDTSFKVVVIICAILLVVAIVLSGVDFSALLEKVGEDSSSSDIQSTTPDSDYYPDDDYYPDYDDSYNDYYPSYKDEDDFNLYVSFNPIMLIFAAICLFSAIRAKKEYMDDWQVVLCFIFTGVFAFMTLFGNSIFEDASSGLEAIIFIISVAITIFAVVLSRVDDLSDVFDMDGDPKLLYVGIPVVTAIVVIIGLISGAFYICLPNIIMIGIYGFLAFGAFGLVLESTDSYEGGMAVLSSALMTGLLLSALFGGFFLIWVHIAVIVGALVVFGIVAGD